MNNVNILFVISAVFVPLLLISLNYSEIRDFYAYSVPLNGISIWEKEIGTHDWKSVLSTHHIYNEVGTFDGIVTVTDQNEKDSVREFTVKIN